MSYVRFADDDWTSDVYVFEDVSGGWTTYVANRHWVWDVELPPPIDLVEDYEGWTERHQKVMAMLGDRINFGPTSEDSEYGHWVALPSSDGYYNHRTPGECADHLERLASLGFHVPAGVVDDLRAEQKEMRL